MIPKSFIDELRARVTTSDVVGRRVKLAKKGKEFSGLCPFHSEKTPSFTVNDEKGFYHCFGCGAHGTAIDFLIAQDNLSFRDAVETLADQLSMEVPRATPEDERREAVAKDVRTVNERAAALFQAALTSEGGRNVQQYLANRGITPDQANRFGLGFALDDRTGLLTKLQAEGYGLPLIIESGLARQPEDNRAAFDFFRGRLMFPIRDRQGKTIAFGGRALGDIQPKYLNSSDTAVFDKGRTLYGLFEAKSAIASKGRAIVTEGYMDVIALHQAGFTEAVAPLGTAITPDQIELLWRMTNGPVLCMDGDAAGQKAMIRAMERALPLLRPGVTLRFVAMPAGEDPDSLIQNRGVGAFADLLEEPVELTDLIWARGLNGQSIRTPDQATTAKREIFDLLSTIENTDVRDAYRAMFNDRLAPYFGRGDAYTGGRSSNRSGSNRREWRGKSGNNQGSRQRVYANREGKQLLELLKSSSHHFDLILLICLRFPQIAERRIEEIGSLEFSDAPSAVLQKAIVQWIFANEILDSDALQCHLNGQSDVKMELAALLDRSGSYIETGVQIDDDPLTVAKALDHYLEKLDQRVERETLRRIGEDGDERALNRQAKLITQILSGEDARVDSE